MGQAHGVITNRAGGTGTNAASDDGLVVVNTFCETGSPEETIPYCESCDLCFVSAQHLQSHLRNATAHRATMSTTSLAPISGRPERELPGERIGLNDLYCIACDQLFLSRGEMDKHAEDTHRRQQPPVITQATARTNPDRAARCRVCNKAFACGLENHLRFATLHRGQSADYCWDEEARRLHKCTICDIRFGSFDALRKHFRDANNHNIRVGPLLNNGSSHGEDDHDQIHTETLYFCEHCVRYFSTANELRAHQNLPEGQRECRGSISRQAASSSVTIHVPAPSPHPLTSPYACQDSHRNRSRILRKPLLSRARASASDLILPSSHNVELHPEIPPVPLLPTDFHDQIKHMVKGKEKVAPREAPRTNQENTERAYDCPLCLEKRSNLSSLGCGHVFCTPCIHEALRTNERCPNCRRTAKRADLRRIFLN